MGDIRRADEFGAVGDILKSQMAKVPEQIRVAVVKALRLFGDKPMQEGLDESVLIQKLAILIHKEGYTAQQMARAWESLDRSERFRPGVAEWARELEAARREDRRAEAIERRIRAERERELNPPTPLTDAERESYSQKFAELRRRGIDLDRVLGSGATPQREVS